MGEEKDKYPKDEQSAFNEKQLTSKAIDLEKANSQPTGNTSSISDGTLESDTKEAMPEKSVKPTTGIEMEDHSLDSMKVTSASKEKDNEAEGMDSNLEQPQKENDWSDKMVTTPRSDASNTKNVSEVTNDSPKKTVPKTTFEGEDERIDDENAEDAEDIDNERRHDIPMPDYEAMSMEKLVSEMQKLVRNESVQSIKKHVDGIKNEFEQKFDDLLESKKEKFIAEGGNEIDFRYNSTIKTEFNEVYNEYREKRNQYYKGLEKNLKENLASRLAIIEELKALSSVEEDMGSTFKAFKDLQTKWRNAGPIPRDHYNTVWRTYRHYTEIFYDYLDLNREMRDLDFKRNLEEKEKLVEKAEALAQEPDLDRVFRELQALHKIWKEDVGPVGQANREGIWERFSNATKVLHERRQEYFKLLDATYEKNLETKQRIISAILALGENISSDHRELQKQIKELEEYRKSFFAAGKVPRNKNQKTWNAFKEAVRNFNKSKNAYYKKLKQEEQHNLDKKRALIDLANALKDSDDLDSTTPKMKRIQADWKKIGHVPRKYSDKIWKEFKSACNHYFDRIHALKNKEREEEESNFKNKTEYIEKIKSFKPVGERDVDLATIKDFIENWKTLGRVPFKKKDIDQKFNTLIDSLFGKLGLNPQQAELLKYGNKIQQLADSDNDRAIENERSFIRSKIDETKAEIRQLETNLQFFSNVSDDNPLVQDVIKKVDVHKAALVTWKSKLKELNIMKNSIERELEAEVEKDSDSDTN